MRRTQINLDGIARAATILNMETSGNVYGSNNGSYDVTITLQVNNCSNLPKRVEIHDVLYAINSASLNSKTLTLTVTGKMKGVAL